jgi:AcrR family transcriptional regulator
LSTRHAPNELPVLGQAPRERADAARNRARILETAARLFAERGAEHVRMDDVAAAAGVGKGTLYRRFGDQAGLALALLEEQEHRLQEAVLRGPPPLGPGADPAERLAAFLAALVDLLERHLDLYLRSEAGAARYRSGAYAFWRLHVRLLVGAAAPEADAEYLADALLAPLEAEHYRYLRQRRHLPADRVAAGLQHLARGAVAPAGA